MTPSNEALEGLIERLERQAIARVLEPTAWFQHDHETQTRATAGRIERSVRQAKAVQNAIVPYRLLPPGIADLLEEARQALSGIVSLDEEDAGPNGESQTCSVTAAKIKATLARNAKLVHFLKDNPHG